MTTNSKTVENEVNFNLQVIGYDRWQDCLNFNYELNDIFAKIAGTRVMPAIEVARLEAKVNGHSFERGVMILLLNAGFEIEELEVEFSNPDKKDWGLCVWYKEHTEYKKPIDDLFKGTALSDPRLMYAMFKTEHAGDQHGPIYSTQMMMNPSCIAPHKTLIYRKVVLVPSNKEKEG